MSSTLFQIIFNPTSAAELAGMPKDLQLQILGEFRGLPDEAGQRHYGKLQSGVKTLHRYRVGNYRVYFECHDLGVVVHDFLPQHAEGFLLSQRANDAGRG